MIINYDPVDPLYILGNGITAEKLKSYIEQEITADIILVDHTDFNKITDKHQCIAGFFNYRSRFAEFLKTVTPRWVTYISNQAIVDPTAKIGQGSVIMPLAMIDYLTEVGDHCMIAPYTFVGHGAIVGSNSVLCPRSTVGGGTKVGNNCYLGPASTLGHQIQIVNDVTCVIGSITTKHITKPGRYFNNKLMKDPSVF